MSATPDDLDGNDGHPWTPPAPGDEQPWYLRLENGLGCWAEGGVTFGVGFERVNYVCMNAGGSSESWVLGYPDRTDASWAVLYRASDTGAFQRLAVLDAWL